jgi:hypothetical protein
LGSLAGLRRVRTERDCKHSAHQAARDISDNVLVERPVRLRTSSQPVIANRRQIDESTGITRGFAQLPWCNR